MEFKLEEYNRITEEILSELKVSDVGATVIALHGNLGAGKTTLTQNICKQLGVIEMVSSPTFVIQKEYDIFSENHGFENLNKIKRIIHIDTYRLENPHDLLALEFEVELKKTENLIIIEWPEKIENILPQDTTHIYIDYLDKDRRSITIK